MAFHGRFESSPLHNQTGLARLCMKGKKMRESVVFWRLVGENWGFEELEELGCDLIFVIRGVEE